MPAHAQRMPHLPRSRYAAELGKIVHDMRFPADLEQEYHIFYLSERRSHVRSFNLIMGVLVTLFAKRAPVDTLQHLRVGTIAALFAVLVWAAYSRLYERVYLQAASVASSRIALIAAVEIAHWIHAGVGELFALLTAYSIGLYFLAGILYHAAVYANVVMTLAP